MTQMMIGASMNQKAELCQVEINVRNRVENGNNGDPITYGQLIRLLNQAKIGGCSGSVIIPKDNLRLFGAKKKGRGWKGIPIPFTKRPIYNKAGICALCGKETSEKYAGPLRREDRKKPDNKGGFCEAGGDARYLYNALRNEEYRVWHGMTKPDMNWVLWTWFLLWEAFIPSPVRLFEIRRTDPRTGLTYTSRDRWEERDTDPERVWRQIEEYGTFIAVLARSQIKKSR